MAESVKVAKSPGGFKIPHPERLDFWRGLMLQCARLVVLGSLVYGSWRYGATQAETLLHISAALLAALGLTILAGRKGLAAQPIPRTLFLLALAWIGYAGLQMMPRPPQLDFFFRGQVAHQQSLVEPGVSDLSRAVEQLSTNGLSRQMPRGTVAIDETQWALVPYLVGLAFAFLTWRLFQSSESRRMLLWVIVVHSVALAWWGILQRAGGNSEILPGIPDRFPGTPFSSFIYKNAGAAAILPGAASAILLLLLKNADARVRRRYASGSSWFGPQTCTLLLCFVVIAIGVGVSLSRGAWVAALVAGIAVPALRRDLISKRLVAMAAAAMIGFALVSVVAAKVGTSVQDRTNDLSLSVIANDQRWDHWQDGARAALAHFPSGSGLGTYGYASLAYQDQTHRGWFREAHNQFLEVATESGLAGVLLLAALLGWFSWLCIRSATSVDRAQSYWGIFGVILLCFATVQSLADFVLVIPSNLALYACLAGVVSSCCMRAGANSVRTPRTASMTPEASSPVAASPQASSSPIFTTIIVGSIIGCSVWAIMICRERLVENRALTASTTSSVEQASKPANTQTTLDLLDDAINRAPRSAALHERRASWHLLHYRQVLVDEAARRGESLDWRATEPLNILNFLANIPASYQATITKDFVSTAKLRQTLSSALRDLHRALELNALRPTLHFRGATLAPFAAMEIDEWLDRSARLSNNDADKLFRNGLIAYMLREDERMMDQWARSLSISHVYIEPIFSLARERVAPVVVAKRIVPPTRPDLLLRLIRPLPGHGRGSAQGADATGSIDVELARTLITLCENSPQIPDELRYATLAELSESLGDWADAADYWGQAVASRPREPRQRLRYVNALLRSRQFQLAFDQAVLGRTLHAEDDRFNRLVEVARGELATRP